MKKIEIGILGFGNIGSGVYKILTDLKDELEIKTGFNIVVKKVLVSDLKKERAGIENSILTDNPYEIINDESIKVIIELIGGLEEAREYIIAAMNKGKHVISGNKLAIAKTGDEFYKEAIDNNVLFYHEASVGGGIPIINCINEELIGNNINKIVGIINGTTNYILSKMKNEGITYNEALKQAQELGYAEANPSSDVDGDDAMYKIAILSNLAYGGNINIKKIYKEGITKIQSDDFIEAEKLGYNIKLLGISEKINNELEINVYPAMISESSSLTNVNDAYNAIMIQSSNLGTTMLYGAGAGSLPTASAVVADLSKILRTNLDATHINSYKKNILANKKVYFQRKIEDHISRYYFRVSDILDKEMEEELSDIIETGYYNDKKSYSVIVTNKIKEKDIISILGKFNVLQFIRIEEI